MSLRPRRSERLIDKWRLRARRNKKDKDQSWLIINLIPPYFQVERTIRILVTVKSDSGKCRSDRYDRKPYRRSSAVPYRKVSRAISLRPARRVNKRETARGRVEKDERRADARSGKKGDRARGLRAR